MTERDQVLPTSLPPRGLSRVQAATYVGVSPTLFDELVKDGRMPKLLRVNARVIWDRHQLDEAFVILADAESGKNDPWGEVSV